MSINNFQRRQPPPARLRPAPSPSLVPEMSLETPPDSPPPSPADSLDYSLFGTPASTPRATPPKTPCEDDEQLFELKPAPRPAYGANPKSCESDPDLLEIPPATICRFMLAVPDKLWPIDREGQENTVDMVASLSANPHCQHFRHLRVCRASTPSVPRRWLGQRFFTPSGSEQVRRGVHQVGEVLFENGSTNLCLGPEISDGGQAVDRRLEANPYVGTSVWTIQEELIHRRGKWPDGFLVRFSMVYFHC